MCHENQCEDDRQRDVHECWYTQRVLHSQAHQHSNEAVPESFDHSVQPDTGALVAEDLRHLTFFELVVEHVLYPVLEIRHTIRALCHDEAFERISYVIRKVFFKLTFSGSRKCWVVVPGVG